MIINFTTREEIRPELEKSDNRGEQAPPQDPLIKIEQEAWDACKHRSMCIDKKQRTIKCGLCGIWLDPVWCIAEIFHYYETRVDQRVKMIEDYEAREKEARERKEIRRKQPRETLMRRRQESLERAAWNEYQAKLLTIRATKQKAVALKIEAQLGEAEE